MHTPVEVIVKLINIGDHEFVMQNDNFGWNWEERENVKR